MPDCGDSSCRYAKKRTGMRTNSHCRCDDCPQCGAAIKPTSAIWHRGYCKMQAWIPPHHRGKMGVKAVTVVNIAGARPFLTIKPVGSVSSMGHTHYGIHPVFKPSK